MSKPCTRPDPRSDERGATIVEYVLLVTFISLVCIASVTALGRGTGDRLGGVAPSAAADGDHTCDGVDDDGDGDTDEDVTTIVYHDADGDGVGGSSPITTCGQLIDHVELGGDVDDEDPGTCGQIGPGNSSGQAQGNGAPLDPCGEQGPKVPATAKGKPKP